MNRYKRVLGKHVYTYSAWKSDYIWEGGGIIAEIIKFRIFKVASKIASSRLFSLGDANVVE